MLGVLEWVGLLAMVLVLGWLILRDSWPGDGEV
jgi:hypothetical protein